MVKIYGTGVDTRIGLKDCDSFELKYTPGEEWIPEFEQEAPLRTELKHFIECIINGLEPITNGQSGMDVVSAIEITNKSISLNGREISFS